MQLFAVPTHSTSFLHKQSRYAFAVPTQPAILPSLPSLKQSHRSYIANLASQTIALLSALPTHPPLPLKQTRRPFTLTSACQAIFLLTHGHFCLSESHIALSEPFRPPKQSGYSSPRLGTHSFAATSAFNINRASLHPANPSSLQFGVSNPAAPTRPTFEHSLRPPNIALPIAPPLSHHSFAATSASQTIRRYTTATSRKNTATFHWCHSCFSSITATSHSV